MNSIQAEAKLTNENDSHSEIKLWLYFTPYWLGSIARVLYMIDYGGESLPKMYVAAISNSHFKNNAVYLCYTMNCITPLVYASASRARGITCYVMYSTIKLELTHPIVSLCYIKL